MGDPIAAQKKHEFSKFDGDRLNKLSLELKEKELEINDLKKQLANVDSMSKDTKDKLDDLLSKLEAVDKISKVFFAIMVAVAALIAWLFNVFKGTPQ